MSRLTPRLLVCTLLSALPVLPASGAEVGVAYGRWSLSNDLADWSRTALTIRQQTPSRHDYVVMVTEEHRFNQPDQAVELQGRWEFLQNWPLDLRLSRGLEENFLPLHAMEIGVTHQYTAGWGARLAGRTATYPAASGARIDSDTLLLMVEKYFSDYRVAYTQYLTEYAFPITGSDSSTSATVALQYFYTEKDSLTLFLSAGDELEYTGGSTPLVIAARGLSLLWRQQLTAPWQLRVTAELQQQETSIPAGVSILNSLINSDVLANAARAATLLAFSVILLLLLQIAVLRLRARWRARRQQRVLNVWRPLLIQTAMGERVELPLLSRFDLDFFLDEWNRLYGVVRGEASSQLMAVARHLKLGWTMRRMLHRRSIRRRLLAIITLGHMQEQDAWDELLAIMQGRQSALSVMAASALMQIDSQRAIRQVLPMVLERSDWPWASVAHVLKMGETAHVCKLLGEATKHAHVAKQTGLLRFLDVVKCDYLSDAIHYVLRNTLDDRVLSVCLHIINDPMALPLVRKYVDHPRWHVRCHAATALGRLGGRDEIILLARLVADKEWWVRYRAAQAIAALPFVTRNELINLRDVMPDRYGRDTLTQVLSETGSS